MTREENHGQRSKAGSRCCCGLALAAVFAAPAQAFDGTAYLGSRGYGGVKSDHVWVYACDIRQDGWGVRTRYHTTYGVTDIVGDGTGGGDNKCGQEPAQGGGTIVWWEVCAGPMDRTPCARDRSTFDITPDRALI